MKQPTKQAKKDLTEDMRKRISPEIRKELESHAQKELEAELQRDAEEAYLEEYRQKLRQEKVPDELLQSVFIDLPEHAPYIMLDGRAPMMPGQTYMLNKAQFDTVREVMYRAWWHEAQRWDDRSANEYRRKLDTQLSAQGVHNRNG